jgi:ADP-ribose pyrophosphatase YjhB (NUDIX family)
MIQFEKNETIFVHRVAAVIVDGDRVLLHRVSANDIWSLPGGQAELMEPSIAGLRREIREAMGVEIQVERLLWVVENFFTEQGRNFHEVGLYFLAHLPPGVPQLAGDGPFSGHEDALNGELREPAFSWFPRTPAALAEIHLLPPFLRDRLLALPKETEIVVNQVAKT